MRRLAALAALLAALAGGLAAGNVGAGTNPRTYNYCRNIGGETFGGLECGQTFSPPARQVDTFSPADAGVTVFEDGSGRAADGSTFPAGTFVWP